MKVPLRRVGFGLAIVAVFLGGGLPGRAAAAPGDTELEHEVERLRTAQERTEARIGELEASRADQLDLADLDERIEAFEDWTWSRLFLAGYGTVSFVDADGAPSTFGMQFNPSMHFAMLDDLHFNAELEIGFEEEDGETATEVELEFATIDYLLSDWLTVSAGKFLVPFNTFGTRYHPQWINKLASTPPIYGGGHGAGGLIPILSDVGLMVSGGVALGGDDSKLNYAIYVVNGAAAGVDDHAEDSGQDSHDDEEAEEGEHADDDGDADETTDDLEAELLELDFENIPDENSNKALGGRIGFLPIPNLEIGGSIQVGRVSGSGGQYNLYGADARYWTSGLELLGEFVYVERKVAGLEPAGWGYYVQGAYRLRYLVNETTGVVGQIGRFEPVVRWGAIEDLPGRDREQLAVGLSYWLYPSVPIKATYEINDGAIDGDRFIAQMSYGF